MLIKRMHFKEQSEVLFVQFHRELNIFGVFNFFPYFANFGRAKTWQHWEG